MASLPLQIPRPSRPKPPASRRRLFHVVRLSLAIALGAFGLLQVPTNIAGGEAVAGSVADSYVSSRFPKRNFGASATLRTEGARQRSYLRLQVPDVPAGTRVVLALFARDANTIGFEVRMVGDTNWTESNVSYRNAPSPGAIIATSGPHGSGEYVHVDVTAAVSGPGTVDVAITSPGASTIHYGSRESATPPRLVVDPETATTTSPTTSSTTPSTTSSTSTSTTVASTPSTSTTSTTIAAPSPSDPLPAPPGTADLLTRKDFIYGSEIGAWQRDGRPTVDPTTGIPSLVRAAKIPVVRFALHDAFTDMRDPLGEWGTQKRSDFDAALDGIRSNLDAEPFIKLLPITGSDTIGTKTGYRFCPPKNDLRMNLPYYRAILDQAGSRVRLYESSNEMEYSCATTVWGFPNAGSVGVSKLLGEHFAQNMPELKKQARSRGFEIVTVGYVGVAGGLGWGDSVSSPNTRSVTEFMTAVHDAYVASGNDPDYIPDAVSIHAYPYSPDFGMSTPLSTIISYYDNWATKNREVINAIWGPAIGSRIRLAMTEWNAGNSEWAGFQDSRVDDFYTAWLQMLRRNDFWLANVFAMASNGTENFDIIRENSTTRRQYHPFKEISTTDPLR